MVLFEGLGGFSFVVFCVFIVCFVIFLSLFLFLFLFVWVSHSTPLIPELHIPSLFQHFHLSFSQKGIGELGISFFNPMILK